MSYDPTTDERLARLAARSQAHRQDLTAPASAPVGLTGSSSPTATLPTGGRAKRNHPARGSRGAALALSAVSTLGLAGWFHQAIAAPVDASTTATAASGTSTKSTATSATGSSTSSATGSSATSSSSGSSSTATSASGSTTSGSSSTATTALADGTYTGSEATTRWGPVQVEITVSNGSITDVQVLESPSNDNKSVAINSRAIPTLTQATLTAQSAKVSSVSGATYTSNAYKTSLQSAIDAATEAAG